MAFDVPSHLLYATTHEWVRLEGSEATVGISDHAQYELSKVLFVELPPVGKQMKANEPCAVVESEKTASDIYSPLTGTVIETNARLNEQAGLLNSAPYTDGWLFKMRLDNPSELQRLLSPERYRQQIHGEEPA